MTFCLLLGAAPGQDQLDKSLDRFLAQSAKVRTLGPSAVGPLGVMKREEIALALPILELRRQARSTTQSLQLKEDEAKALCASWVSQARVLSRLGVEFSSRLDKKAAIAKVDDRDLLFALDRAIHIRLAQEAIGKYLGRGAFHGMYDHLKSRGLKIAQAFLFIFSDRIESAMKRAYAADGVAELCPPANRSAFRKKIALIHGDDDETPAMKDTAMILLARLGDRKLLDARLLENRNIVVEELSKEAGERSYRKLLLSYQQSADLLQRVGDNDTAAEVNTDYIRLVLNLCTFASQTAEARSNIAGQCYDFACILSQLGRIDFALHMLETSFNWGLTAFDWAKTDKDLTALRKHPGFNPLVERWQSGKSKPGSIAYNDATYLTKAGRVTPVSKPTSRPGATTNPKGSSKSTKP